MTIAPLPPMTPAIAPQTSTSASNAAPASGDGSFDASLRALLEVVDKQVVAADDLATRQVRGEDVQLHDVALAMEKADVSMRLAMKTRNKIVEAYQEIMRMPV